VKNSSAQARFLASLPEPHSRLARELDSPAGVQSFLNTLQYSDEPVYRCPVRVLKERKAHCVDGALLAAALLRLHGRPPLICMLVPNNRDDVHYLALFRDELRWGAVAQSNFVGLRFREPVFASLRELALSYFEQYYNVEGEKTLRGHTAALNLRRLDSLSWMESDTHLEELVERVDRLRVRRLISKTAAGRLSRVDERTYRAGLLGANQNGLFRPDRSDTPD
jgi:hypothetical protein